MDRLVVRWEKVIEVELGVPRRLVMEKVVDASWKMVIEKELVPRRMLMEKVVDAPFVASFFGIQGIPEHCTL